MNAPPRFLAAAERLTRIRASGVLTAMLVAGTFVNPARPLPIDLCLWHRLTGLGCPTCGLTRAVCHALQGDWGASLAFHPAGILVAVSVLGWVTWMSLEVWKGQMLWVTGRKTLARLAGAAILVISLASWIARV
jgi:hypothetical protein